MGKAGAENCEVYLDRILDDAQAEMYKLSTHGAYHRLRRLRDLLQHLMDSMVDGYMQREPREHDDAEDWVERMSDVRPGDGQEQIQADE